MIVLQWGECSPFASPVGRKQLEMYVTVQ